MVPANHIDDESLTRAAPEFRNLPLSGPRVVAATLPASQEELTQLRIANVMGGHDVPDLPHLYVPYSQLAKDAARSARLLVRLAQHGKESSDAVSAFVNARGDGMRNLGYLPVRARNRDLAAVIDRTTGEIVGYLAVNPW